MIFFSFKTGIGFAYTKAKDAAIGPRSKKLNRRTVMTNTAKLISKIAKLNVMTAENGCTAEEAENAAELAEAAIFELELEGISYDEAVEAAELEAFEQMLNADFAAEGDKAVLLLTEETTENTMEAEVKAVSVTERAWTLYRAAEVEAGRKFTAADRKGKSSEWAKAMRKAYDDVMRERRVAAVQHLIVPVPEYNYWSADPEKSSEYRRREANAAATHNMRILAEASERPLNKKQAAEAKALGLSVRDYNAAKKWADENCMSVTKWIRKLKAEEMVAKGRKQLELRAWCTEQILPESKKKVAMRGRYKKWGGCDAGSW